MLLLFSMPCHVGVEKYYSYFPGTRIFCRYKPPDQVAEIFRQGLVEGEKQVRDDENYDDGSWGMRI